MAVQTATRVVLLVLAAATARDARAQDASPRPVRGPSRAEPRGDRHQSLDLTIGLTAAGDNNLVAERAKTSLDPHFQKSAIHSGLRSDLVYASRGSRLSFDLKGGTSLRYYPELHDRTTVLHHAGLGVSSALWPGAKLNVGQTMSYSPYYTLNFFSPTDGLSTSGEFPLASADYAVFTRKVFSYQTSADLTQALTRRSSLAITYGLRTTNFVERDDPDLKAERMGATLVHQLGNGASFHAGYGISIGHLAGQVTRRSHDLDVGVDYARGLSLTRRMKLGFGSGSSIVPVEHATHYRARGNATLTYEIGRTWGAQLTYTRGLEFIEYDSDPSFFDAVNVNVAGNLGRRLELSLSAAYSTGQVGITERGRGFERYTGSSQLRVAMTRYAAAQFQYFYYGYHFAPGLDLPTDYPRGLGRHGVRAGLTYRAPLYRSRR